MNSIIERKIEHAFNKPYIFMIIIGAISFLVRIIHLPQNIPLTFDSLLYFSYATDIVILGHLPDNYQGPNNGWPAFLSIFFALFHFDNFLDYMTLQRLVSVCLSTLAIIPIYYLCRRFFDVRYSLVGVALFAFDPRIIQNSVLGITEPLFIVLVTSSLCLLLSNNIRSIYGAFAVAALATLVRYEGVLMLVVLSVIYFVNHRRENWLVPKYALAVAIFVLVLFPMTYWRLQNTGQDGVVSHIVAGAEAGFILTQEEENQTLALILFVMNGVSNMIKYLGWVMIPCFVFFVPIGFYLMIREKRHRLFILLTIAVLLVPALYAYSRGYQETRYLYTIYPLFCILALFTVKRFAERFKAKNIVLVLIVCGIILSSATFLVIKQIDTEHQREAFEISNKITDLAKGVNNFEPEHDYLLVASFPKEWPVLKSEIPQKTKVIWTAGFDTLEDFIKNSRDEGLTHLVVDDRQNRPPFIKDVLHNEKKYPYLEKVFDSSESGYDYKVKIFRIDYDLFDSTR